VSTFCGTHSCKGYRKFPFDTKQLAGEWIESIGSEPICLPISYTHGRIRMKVDAVKKRFVVSSDEIVWETPKGEKVTQYGANILSASKNKLVVQYDDENQYNQFGKL
jgi:hypothetical protein